jgi:hypothetical protein
VTFEFSIEMSHHNITQKHINPIKRKKKERRILPPENGM